MRTYLTTANAATQGERELVMTCNCGVTKRLAEFVPAGVRPKSIGSINLLRLLQWAGEFLSDHASCPNEAPAPAPVTKAGGDLGDIPFLTCSLGAEPSAVASVLRRTV